MMNGVGRCSAGHQMGSAQSNKQNRNSLGLVKPALTKALTKSLVHPSDRPTLTSKQLSSLRTEVVQPAKLLMEGKWGVEGLELVNLLEFKQVWGFGLVVCFFFFPLLQELQTAALISRGWIRAGPRSSTHGWFCE